MVAMIREIQPKSMALNINQGGQINSRFAATPDSNMQQSGIRPKSQAKAAQNQ